MTDPTPLTPEEEAELRGRYAMATTGAVWADDVRRLLATLDAARQSPSADLAGLPGAWWASARYASQPTHGVHNHSRSDSTCGEYVVGECVVAGVRVTGEAGLRAEDEALAFGEAGLAEDADDAEGLVRDLHAAGYRVVRLASPSTPTAQAAPALDVDDVRLLTHAVTHLLADHDCDRHGWETLQEANLRVRGALDPSTPLDAPRCGNCPHDPDAHSPVNRELCAYRDCECPGLLTVTS